jgi:hypothetical protein
MDRHLGDSVIPLPAPELKTDTPQPDLSGALSLTRQAYPAQPDASHNQQSGIDRKPSVPTQRHNSYAPVTARRPATQAWFNFLRLRFSSPLKRGCFMVKLRFVYTLLFLTSHFRTSPPAFLLNNPVFFHFRPPPESASLQVAARSASWQKSLSRAGSVRFWQPALTDRPLLAEQQSFGDSPAHVCQPQPPLLTPLLVGVPRK